MLFELALLTGGVAYYVYQRRSRSRLRKALQIHATADKLHDPNLDAGTQKVLEHTESHANREILICGGTLVAAFLSRTSLFFTGLSILSLVYLALPAMRVLVNDWKAGRYLTVYSVGMVAFVGMILQGRFVLMAIGGIIGNLFFRMVKLTESSAKHQLTDVFDRHPSRIWIEQNGGSEIEVDFHQLRPGDIVIVNAGEVVPVDGVIASGEASIDQRVLTGESLPVEREVGDEVFAATQMISGRIRVKVGTAGEETVAAKIGKVLDNTQHYKENLIARGRKIADDYLPITVGVAALTWPLLGYDAALTVLFASLGANMIVLGPISILVYFQIMTRHGIMVKDGRVLESVRDLHTFVFDKTGTLTLDEPQVGAVHCLAHWDQHQLLRYAAAAEHRQQHPIARAILAKAKDWSINPPPVNGAHFHVGYGIRVQVEQHTVHVGSARFLSREGLALSDQITSLQHRASDDGGGLIYVGIDGVLAGVFELEPTIRPEAAEIIAYLKQHGMETCIMCPATMNARHSVWLSSSVSTDILPKSSLKTRPILFNNCKIKAVLCVSSVTALMT
uniref:P-type Zn(2+) transporter n=1 Tax=Candidatus Kentrum sp. LPFa TaxID=2126335 RepID=A0A450WSG8_9GAMM|nr:MAG: ATPase, P-type (transporting), HAD superfamily, subfamily IC [Candidatus Kentron sp. LPFa]